MTQRPRRRWLRALLAFAVGYGLVLFVYLLTVHERGRQRGERATAELHHTELQLEEASIARTRLKVLQAEITRHGQALGRSRQSVQRAEEIDDTVAAVAGEWNVALGSVAAGDREEGEFVESRPVTVAATGDAGALLGFAAALTARTPMLRLEAALVEPADDGRFRIQVELRGLRYIERGRRR